MQGKKGKKGKSISLGGGNGSSTSEHPIHCHHVRDITFCCCHQQIYAIKWQQNEPLLLGTVSSGIQTTGKYVVMEYRQLLVNDSWHSQEKCKCDALSRRGIQEITIKRWAQPMKQENWVDWISRLILSIPMQYYNRKGYSQLVWFWSHLRWSRGS